MNYFATIAHANRVRAEIDASRKRILETIIDSDQYFDGDLIDQTHAAVITVNGKLVRTYVDEKGIRVKDPIVLDDVLFFPIFEPLRAPRGVRPV